MARTQEQKVRSFIAAVDLSAKKFHGVKLNANYNEVTVAVAGDAEFVLINDPKLGEVAEVAMLGGESQGHAGAAVAIGDEVASDASGKLIPAVSTNNVVGIALSAAATDEYFEMERVRYVKA